MADGWDEAEDEWVTDPQERDRLERDAVFAFGAGMVAMVFAMCTYSSYGCLAIPAIVIGGIALYLGRSVRNTGVQGAAGAYATMAMTTGGFAAGWAALILLLCGLVVALGTLLAVFVFSTAGMQ